jgi:FG-GAP repeat/FG-GAP-like repeat
MRIAVLRFRPSHLGLLVFAGLVGVASAQSQVRVIHGANAGDGLGRALHEAGDWDLDQLPDLAARSGYRRVSILSSASGAALSSVTELGASGFGDDISSGADLDGDGHPDLIVGAEDDLLSGSSSGSVRAYRGPTLTPLWTRVGTAATDSLGHSVDMVGDLTGDGRSEVIVGAPQGQSVSSPGPGYALVLRGHDGSTLYTLIGAAGGDAFGDEVAGVGDVNGDGKPDFAVGAPEHAPGGTNDGGRIYVYSGANGSLLFAVNGNTVNMNLGDAISGAGDVSGDGLADVIIGAPSYQSSTGWVGVYRYSGSPAALGVPVHVAIGSQLGGRLGYSVDGIGDTDGDTWRDFAAGAPTTEPIPGAYDDAGIVRVYDGASGLKKHDFWGENSNDWFGGCVVGLGASVDGDSHPDFACAAPYDDTPLNDAGSIRLDSGAVLPLGASVFAMSVYGQAPAKQQPLSLAAGPSFANKFYLLLGSASGTNPGTPAGPSTLPLNLDSYLLLTLSNPNSPPLLSSFKPLNSSGHGSAAVVMPQGATPSLIGLTLHHAYVVFHLIGPTIVYTSNAVPLALTGETP